MDNEIGNELVAIGKDHNWKEMLIFAKCKILVTGAKGFGGSNLCAQLKNIRDGKARNDGVPFDENVSTKVVRIIQSYVGVVNKMVWRKF